MLNPFSEILSETNLSQREVLILNSAKPLHEIKPKKDNKVQDGDSAETCTQNNNLEQQFDQMINDICEMECKILKFQRDREILDISVLSKRLSHLRRTYDSFVTNDSNPDFTKSPRKIFDENNSELPLCRAGSEISMIEKIEKKNFVIDEIDFDIRSKSSFDEYSSPRRLISRSSTNYVNKSSDWTANLDEYPYQINRGNSASRLSIAKSRYGNRLSMDVATTSVIHPLLISRRSSRIGVTLDNEDVSPCRNFIEFCHVGIKLSILLGLEKPCRSNLQPAVVLDRFPTSEPIIGDAIVDFAMPSGCEYNLIYGIESAEAICRGYGDKYHILQFSDKNGIPSFGCCLTVMEVIALDAKKHKQTICDLQEIFMMRIAVEIIARFFRNIVIPKSSAASVLNTDNNSIVNRRVVLNKEGIVVGYLPAETSKVVSHSNKSMRNENASKPGEVSYPTPIPTDFGNPISRWRQNLKTVGDSLIEGFKTNQTNKSSSLRPASIRGVQLNDIVRNSEAFKDNIKRNSAASKDHLAQISVKANSSLDDAPLEDMSVTSSTVWIPSDSLTTHSLIPKKSSAEARFSSKPGVRPRRLQLLSSDQGIPCLVSSSTYCLVSTDDNHAFLFKVENMK